MADDTGRFGFKISKTDGFCGCGCLSLLGLFFLFLASIPFWGKIADWIWLRSVGAEQIFTTRYNVEIGLGLGTAAAVVLSCVISLLIARRIAARGNLSIYDEDPAEPKKVAKKKGYDDYYDRYAPSNSRYGLNTSSGEELVGDLAASRRWTWGILAALIAFLALIEGLATAGSWQTFLLWQHAVPFSATGASVTDPIFHLDLGYFFFTLPAQELALRWAGALLEAVFLITGLWYLAAWFTRGNKRPRAMVVHLAVLAAARVALGAPGFWLGKFDLSFSQNGWATGVGATDAAARFGAFDQMALLTLLLAAMIVGFALFLRKPEVSGPAIGVVVAVVFIVPLIWVPVASIWNQRISVSPNEQISEQPYIVNNIAMTRLGYNLDSWTPQAYPDTSPLTAADLTADAATLANARLWDYRPLQQTLDQLQTVRQYYDFTDVDIDRYLINGSETQVMLSARELDPAKNPAGQNFINDHIVYTHGFGAAMVTTNAVTNDGLPQLIIQNIPPVSSGGAPVITEPRIYFGEGNGSNEWVLVGAKSDEFDTSTGSTGDTTTRWSGNNGINIGSSLVDRLFWSLEQGSSNLLLTDQVTPSTQLLLHRNITDRLSLVAPFLHWDGDPYLVITEAGKLVWVVDGYTTTNQMPDSTHDTSSLDGANFNYIRNSVKATVDAYTGAINLYDNDPADPLLRAWESIYPGLIKPLTALPVDIAAHLRAPEDLLNIQIAQYGAYHVTDPGSFYKSDNVWTVPQANNGDTNAQSLPTQAYYTEMRLPGETKTEYMLMQPMVLKGRPNMIAWVGVRQDAPNRGQVVVYQMSSNTTNVGPAQVESSIDSNAVISQQLTLWNQNGSKVVRGNLLTMPVGNTFLYIEPLYLQSTALAYPKFVKVIVASGNNTAWGDNLDQALTNLLKDIASGGTSNGGNNGGTPGASPSPTASPASSPTAVPSPTATPGPDNLPNDEAGLIAYADTHYQAAQTALKSGSLTAYEGEMQKVGAALDKLMRLYGAGASPLASAKP